MEEIKTIGGYQLPQGADGGHYTPVITQPTADTMKVEFQPSKTGMAAVEPVEIKLPVGSGSGVSYTLPVANANTLGGVKAQAKTAAMTQPVGADEDGNLYTLPPAQSTTEVGGVRFDNHVGNLYSPDNRLSRLPALGDDVLALTGGSQKYLIFRAKPDTTYVCTFVSAPGAGNFGQADFAGICTQVPGAPGPVDLVGNFRSGGYGKYFVMRTNANFRDATAYLIWQLGGSADLTNVAIYEGDSIEGYDTINPYSPENGTATSNDLVVRTRNLDPEISRQLHRGHTAVQPEDLAYAKPAGDAGNFSSPVAVGDTALGSLRTMLNSVAISKEWLDTQIKLGEHYAHCPSVNVVGGKAYISAFENTEGTTDSYVPKGVNTHLYVVDIATMTQEAEYIVAQHGDTVGGLTFAYGSGACQSVMIDATTLRTVFVALLQDATGVDDWYQCYRDFDISANEFGPIGLCQILDTDGNAHRFSTTNADLYIQHIDPIAVEVTLDNGEKIMRKVNTNIVCQPAMIGNTWYVACGCQERWPNMPILTTEDWITFRYWATPSVDGNYAHYEMAIATAIDGYLYTATRQIKGKNAVQLMKINPADKSVAGHVQIPAGNDSRPFIMPGSAADAKVYIWHILTTARGNSAQVSVINRNGLYQGATAAATTPPCVYPSVAALDGGGYFAAYMVPFGLYCCKFSGIERYDGRDTVGIAAKLIELVGG